MRRFLIPSLLLLFTACPSEFPCGENYVYQLSASSTPEPSGSVMSLYAFAYRIPHCETSVSDDGVVTLEIGNSLDPFSNAQGGGDECRVLLDREPSNGLVSFRYCAQVSGNSAEDELAVDQVDIELEHNGSVYVPSLGWRDSGRIYCEESDTVSGDISCGPDGPD